MKKSPNPKHHRNDKPDVPICSVNSKNHTIGRQYNCSRTGKEACFVYIEKYGVRKYVTEKWFDDILKQGYEAKNGL